MQYFRFETLMGLEPVDRLVAKLAQVSSRSVPDILERQRRQLQDANLDTHFMLGLRRVAMAADPDHLLVLTALFNGMGAEVVAAVARMRTQRRIIRLCAGGSPLAGSTGGIAVRGNRLPPPCATARWRHARGGAAAGDGG